MKNKLLFLTAFVLINSGIWANTCSTAVSISLKSSFAPDTFQISGTEMWFTFTGNDTATFYINSFIDNNFAGINQLDLYSGNCTGLNSLVSFTSQDSLLMFRYIFTSGNQYYLKVSRPSGLNPGNFTIIGATGPPEEPVTCPWTDCNFILNSGFELWGFTPPPNFFTDYLNMIHYNICGWSAAWGTPNIKGTLGNPIVHMFAASNNPLNGEALVTSLTERPLINDATYTLHFDYLVANAGSHTGNLQFVLSNALLSSFPSFNFTVGAPNYIIPEATQTVTTASPFDTWIPVTVNIHIPATGVFNTLVIVPKSNDIGQFIHIYLDNISITENYSASISSSTVCSSNTTLTANNNQTPPNGPYSYLWSTSATTQSINVTTAGLYSVTISNDDYCTATAQYTVLQNLSGTFNSASATCGNCNGSVDLTVTGGTAPYTYHWTDANNNTIAGTQDISSLCAGEYYVTVTDINGCTWAGSQVVTEDLFTNSSWPQITNSYGNEEICDMTTDASGNVYAIGYFTYLLQIGTFNFSTISPDKGIFIVKYDYCGKVLNVRHYGGVRTDIPDLHIELCSNGRLLVAGEYSTIDFTGGANTMTADGCIDIFLATLDPVTLLCTAGQQINIHSTGCDFVKGISVKSNAVYIAGVFSGPTLFFSNSATTLPLTGGLGDLFVCRFIYTLASMNWAQNYPNINYDKGFTLQSIAYNNTPFFTYMQNDAGGTGRSYIAKLNSGTGAIVTSAQLGTGTDYFEIYDMNSYSNVNNLYLCGYYKTSTSAQAKQAAVIYYSTPNTSLAWTGATSRLSFLPTSPVSNCEATKVAVNANGVFVSGTYNYSGFKVGTAPANWSPSISVYGTTNHFVYKTDAILTPASTNGWLSGVASSTTGTSRSNTLYNDATHNVYYLGGAFNGNVTLTGLAGQTMTPYAGGYDGFVARFQDNGMADYKSLEFFKDSLSKAENSDVIVYPNPSTGNFTMASITNEAITNISVTDLTGRVVFNKSFENEIFETNSDLSFLPASTYFISILTTNKLYNNKLIIVK